MLFIVSESADRESFPGTRQGVVNVFTLPTLNNAKTAFRFDREPAAVCL